MKEMPLQAVLKILGKMTSNKVLEPRSSETQAVCGRIQCEATLKKVEPIKCTLHTHSHLYIRKYICVCVYTYICLSVCVYIY